MSQDNDAIWVVLVKHPRDKRSRLIAPQGRTTALRIRASMFTEADARAAVTSLQKLNPGFIFKAKPWGKRR